MIYLAFQDTDFHADDPSSVFWNHLLVSAAVPLPLNDETDTPSGFSFEGTTATGGWRNLNFVTGDGTGDAAWVDEGILADGWSGLDTYKTATFSGFDSAKTYDIEVVPTSSVANTAEVRINGGTPKTLAAEFNTSQTLLFRDVAPVSGELVIEWRRTDSGEVFLTAGRISEAVIVPLVSVTQANLSPGGTISGEFSGFDTIPTTLEGIRGSNTIGSAGTEPQITGLQISETLADGKYSGTFTATISPLVSTGTQQFLRFSDSGAGIVDPTWRLS